MNLKRRSILITGGGSGIGLALARSLAGDNDVVIASRAPDKLKRAADREPNLRSVLLDVTSERESRAAVNRTVELLGHIDLLVNCAGVLRRKALDAGAAAQAAEEEVAVAATKAAVHSLARSLRADLAGQVKVFDVLLPIVDTELTKGIGRTKLAPREVAAEIVDGHQGDRFEIRIGRVNALAALGRILPSAADRIIAREIGAPPGA